MRPSNHSIISALLACLLLLPVACSKQEAPAPKAVEKKAEAPKKEETPPAKKSGLVTGDKALLSLGLEAINKLTPQERILLGSYMSLGPRSFIGQLSDMAPVTMAALRSADPKGVLLDDYRRIMHFSLVLPIRGDFSAIREQKNMIYADRTLKKKDFVGPALMMPFPLTYGKESENKTAYAKVQVTRETHMPLDAALGKRLKEWFSPSEGFLTSPKSTMPGMKLELEGFKPGEKPPLKVHLIHTGADPMVLPVLNPPTDPSVDRRKLVGKVGMYRQLAWMLQDKNGDVVGYSRPIGITDLKKDQKNQLQNLLVRKTGDKSILLLPMQGDIWAMTGTEKRMKNIGPFTLTACFTSLMSKEGVMKQWPEKTKDHKDKAWFEGWVCSEPVTIDKPMDARGGLVQPSWVPAFEDKTLKDILTR